MDYPCGALNSGVSVKVEPDFEPQTRARSNTWPCPCPEDPARLGLGPGGTPGAGGNGGEVQSPGGLMGFPKKSTSRRNAWGNMSYADLITQAIQSSPEKRLTLSQIYDWMVTNVPYFKDKGDSNSSAGWKNSIRHNLSLHNRFMRVQNEGTGKSSWWMLNPDAKPGKAARRRATSMETSKFEKKRGRIKKKLEAIRNGVNLDTPSPSSSLSEGLDNFPESPQVHNFNLSPSDFRPRASSNASSCGRLSPILSEVVDLHDNQVPPMSPWDPYGYYSTNSLGSDRFGAEQLAGNLANTMKLHETSGSFDFHQQTFRQPQQSFGGGPAAAVNHRGSFSRPAAIPTTIRQNDVVQQSADAQLLNGLYGGAYANASTAFLPSQAHLQQDKLMSGPHSHHTELDINFELEANPFGSLNVEEVLQTELSLGEDIGFNFGGPTVTNHIQQHNNVAVPSTTSINAPNSPYNTSVGVGVPHHHHQQPATGRQWVH